MKPFDFKPKAVLFDMDGVLVDTEPMSRAGWTKALLKMGFELSEESYANILAGSNRDGCRERLKAMYGEELDYDEVARVRNEYVRAFRIDNGVELKKGVLNLLNTLNDLGISCCVATSTIKKHAEDLLESLGLLRYFKKVIGGDDVINGKPDPEIYLKAAKEMNARPDECLVIEDSRLGTEAAYRGGIKVIFVPDLQEPDETSRSRAYAVCKDLNEVAKRIKAAASLEGMFLRPFNYAENLKTLTGHICRRFEDIALVLFSSDRIVSKETAVDFVVGEAFLIDTALENSARRFPPFIVPLEVVFMDVKNADKIPAEQRFFMNPEFSLRRSMLNKYYLSADKGGDGALSVFYPGVPERLCEILGDDIFITLNSARGAYIYPASYFSAGQIKETGGSDAEMLSKNIFVYRRKEKALTVVK